MSEDVVVNMRSTPGGLFRNRLVLITAEFVRSRYKPAMKRSRANFKQLILERRSEIERNIRTFDTYFKAAGYRCPLPQQFAQSAERGLPSRSLVIDSLLYLELTSGVLMGVQDESKFVGPRLRFGLAGGGEEIMGFSGPVTCSNGEPVIYDELGPIASIFQGPDRRVNVDETTTRLAFFVFDAPGLPTQSFEKAVAEVEMFLQDAGTFAVSRSVDG